MTVQELNRDQLIQLKQAMLAEQSDSVSYGELANADSLVRDADVILTYFGVDFSEDDFSM